jgi:predicted dehydrogenase
LTLKIAVIGVGYLGKIHAAKYAALDSVELAYVVDVDQASVDEVAKSLGVKAETDYTKIIQDVDAVSIVVPTKAHFDVAAFCLSQKKHVLLEKPITVTVDEADRLITLAAEHKVILQVGHLERFNSTVMALSGKLDNPRFIESTRIAPFNLRGTDVNVMLDLMIHDIDIIQSMVNSPIAKIDANGACVLSDKIDIANARIEFDNGCVANVTASRVSLKSERKMRIFQHDAYFSLDLQNKVLNRYERGEGEMFPGIPAISHDETRFEADDPIKAEIENFIDCIQTGKPPVVTGADGKRSLETAIKITEMVHEKEHRSNVV